MRHGCYLAIFKSLILSSLFILQYQAFAETLSENASPPVIIIADNNTQPVIPVKTNPMNPPKSATTSSTVSSPTPPSSMVKPTKPVAAISPIEAAAKITSIPINDLAIPDTQSTQLWNLQDADIHSVINEVALETGKNFIVDPRVTGKISLISSKPIKSSEVYDLFLSVLSLLGYSAIPSGDVVKVVPNIESGTYATPVASAASPGKGDEVVLRIIPLENISATQLIPILRPLLPQWSTISAYAPGNILMILGRAANLQRILYIVHEMDQASDNGNIDVIPVRNSSATQLVTVLNNLQNTSRAAGEAPQAFFAADERSNSILLSGSKKAKLRMRALILQLDTPNLGGKNHGDTEVIFLKYLQAKTFAPILGKIAQNISGKEKNGEGGATTTVSVHATATTPPQPPPTIPGHVMSGNTLPSPKTPEPDNKTNIQAEPSTNSLIITAQPGMMKALRNVVTRLDVRPAQVLVEGLIVEIDEDDVQKLGFQWGAYVTNAQLAAVSNNGMPPLGNSTIAILPSLTTKFNDILQFIQTQTHANILATPSIMVLDNQSAMVSIGQEISVQNGAYSTTGGGTSPPGSPTPFNTFDREKVVLKLQVKPQINLGDSVKLTIKLKNDTLQNPDNPGLNPTINTSEIQNVVIVRTEDTLVLGGLISNTLSETRSQVPILGDIPILGQLFQFNTHRYQRRNLLVFLKPTILRTADNSNIITESKYDPIRKTQIEWPKELDHGSAKRENILPRWDTAHKLPEPFEP